MSLLSKSAPPPAPRHGTVLRMEFAAAVEALGQEGAERREIVQSRIAELESEQADLRVLQDLIASAA